MILRKEPFVFHGTRIWTLQTVDSLGKLVGASVMIVEKDTKRRNKAGRKRIANQVRAARGLLRHTARTAHIKPMTLSEWQSLGNGVDEGGRSVR